MSPIQQMLLGVGAKDKTYIDDLFSMALRTGNGGNKTIENNLDLSNEGGIVWVKERNSSNSHTLFATDMPDISSKRPYLSTNSSSARGTKSNIDIAFYSNGYQIQGNDGQINQASGNTYVDWSMRKAPGFFDVVTYSGNSTARTIAHSLGCVPGSIWVKSLTEGQSWSVYHRKSNSSPEDYKLRLDDTNAAFTWNPAWNSTLPTSTHFSLGTHGSINGSGHDYIALIFAHDEQIFGESGNASVIKCDSWTGSGSAGLEVNVGFEPQWILFKNASASYNWYVLDVMRGIVSSADDKILAANDSGAEWDSSYIDVTPTGFKLQTSHALGNASGNTYVYIAIRRPDGYCGKPIETGTDAFNIATADSTVPAFNANFAVDFAMFRRTTASYNWNTSARLIQTKYLRTNATNTESIENDYMFDYNDGWNKQTAYANTEVSWMWKRHGAGFDVVTYEGEGVSGQQVSHGLNAVPEMMWVKRRDGANRDWQIYHKGLNGGTNPEQYKLLLNTNAAEAASTTAWSSTAPTSNYITLGHSSDVNTDGSNYIAMLFGSVDGISKVGYYTGSSSDQTITTGFTPRFLIVKRANGSGDWYVIDTVIGNLGSSGNDTAIYLNKNESKGDLGANYVNTTSTGFVLPGNVAGDFHYVTAKYIYYAHA